MRIYRERQWNWHTNELETIIGMYEWANCEIYNDRTGPFVVHRTAGAFHQRRFFRSFSHSIFSYGCSGRYTDGFQNAILKSHWSMCLSLSSCRNVFHSQSNGRWLVLVLFSSGPDNFVCIHHGNSNICDKILGIQDLWPIWTIVNSVFARIIWMCCRFGYGCYCLIRTGNRARDSLIKIRTHSYRPQLWCVKMLAIYMVKRMDKRLTQSKSEETKWTFKRQQQPQQQRSKKKNAILSINGQFLAKLKRSIWKLGRTWCCNTECDCCWIFGRVYLLCTKKRIHELGQSDWKNGEREMKVWS